MDSFQLNRNSHNALHWLPGPKSKCLGWKEVDVKALVGQSPSLIHLMLQPRCPTAALRTGTDLGPVTDHRSCSALQ